jgi:hypothetical protein
VEDIFENLAGMMPNSYTDKDKKKSRNQYERQHRDGERTEYRQMRLNRDRQTDRQTETEKGRQTDTNILPVTPAQLVFPGVFSSLGRMAGIFNVAPSTSTVSNMPYKLGLGLGGRIVNPNPNQLEIRHSDQ